MIYHMYLGNIVFKLIVDKNIKNISDFNVIQNTYNE